MTTLETLTVGATPNFTRDFKGSTLGTPLSTIHVREGLDQEVAFCYCKLTGLQVWCVYTIGPRSAAAAHRFVNVPWLWLWSGQSCELV